MNKIKLAFVATAILAAVGGAFATKPCLACENSQQYMWNGTNYVPVGTYGVNYDCYVGGGTCTYYIPDPWTQPNVYAPCRQGGYTPF